MSSIANYPHICLDENGIPRIHGTRYKVLHLATEHHHYGWSAEELLRQHPDLKPEEIYAALTFFYDHFDEMVAEMDAMAERVEVLHNTQSLSRAELLARGAGNS